jgi:hypothetical protein
MAALGFREKNRHFTHAESEQVVELPPGPRAIDDESSRDTVGIKHSTGTLRLFSPTDCVKDRLAAGRWPEICA